MRSINDLFYMFKGLVLLIWNVLNVPLVYLFFPLIPFIRIYSNLKNKDAIFKNIFVDSALVSFLHAIYYVLFVEFSVRLLETIMSHPVTVEGFLNKMGGTYERNIIEFFIYIQLFVIILILLWNLFCSKAFPYLVQIGRKGKF